MNIMIIFDHQNQSIHRRHPIVVGATLSCLVLLAACSDSKDPPPVTNAGTQTVTPAETTQSPTSAEQSSAITGGIIVPPSNSNTQQPDQTETTTPETETTTPESETTTNGGVGSLDTGGMFPDDKEGDDLPSLIVTGVNGADPKSLDAPWLVSFFSFRLDGKTTSKGNGRAYFFDYAADNFKVNDYTSFYSEDLDVCKIYDPRVPGEASDSTSNLPPRASAGEAITINSPAGLWFTINQRRDDDNLWEYITDSDLPGPLPEGATLSIPGDEFPKVQAYPLYEPQAPVRLLPGVRSDLLTSASAYAWVPGTGKTYITLDFIALDVKDGEADFAGYCYLVDDGSFNMPEEIKKFIDETDLDIQARYSRYYERVDYSDGIVFRQLTIVAESSGG